MQNTRRHNKQTKVRNLPPNRETVPGDDRVESHRRLGMRMTKPAKPGFRQLHRMETLGPETGSRFRQTKTGTRPGDSLSHMQTYALLSTTLTQMPEASEHAKHQQHVRPHEQMPLHTTTTATHTTTTTARH